MSNPIERPSRGALARNQKMIEVIRRLNPLLKIEVRYTDPESSPIVKYSDSNVVIELPGEPAGGLPEGFNEEILDVVNLDNTAGQRVFLTRAV